MLRWLLWVLLLINAVAYYWFTAQKSPEVGGGVARGSNAGELILLSERAASVTAAGDDVVASHWAGDCLVFGPLEQQATEQLATGLGGIDVPSGQWSTEEVQLSGYWVYLPPFASRAEAQRQLNEISRKGIDSFVFEEGELANGVSFGIYSSRKNATRRRQELQELGYRTEVKAATRNLIHHWLQIALDSRSGLADKFWSDLENIAPEAKISEKSCQAVASYRDIP